jgi:hypothetical protein
LLTKLTACSPRYGWFRAPHDRAGNLPLFPGIFPDQVAPIVRRMPGPRSLAARRSRTFATSEACIGGDGVSVTTFGILAAAWFIAVQLFLSGVGGYLAGRLRTRWVSVHTDEVYFRDTAHGLIVWGVGAIVTAWLLTSGAATVVSGASHAGSAIEAAGTAVGGPAAQAAGQAASSEGSTAYFTDMLFRTDHPDTSGDPAAARAEVGRILATDALSGEMPAADKAYVAQVVAARTGLSQADAEKRGVRGDRAGDEREGQGD